MEMQQVIALIIFAIAIVIIITGIIDRSAGAAFGALAMVLFGVMGPEEAFEVVDWNVIFLLVSIWLIASYFNQTGIPEWLAVASLRLSGQRIPVFLVLLCFLAAYISTLVDNVVVILMMAPVIFRVAGPLGLRTAPFLLLVGLSANLMGTALIIGDLPPQLLHSVAGAEFFDFIWQFGRPSSFPILSVAFIATIAVFYLFAPRFITYRTSTAQVVAVPSNPISPTSPEPVVDSPVRSATPEPQMAGPSVAVADREEQVAETGVIKNPPFAAVVTAGFVLTITAMAARQTIGLPLGYIATMGAFSLIVILEIFRRSLRPPQFEYILAELDWRAILFYVALFVLVGGLEHAGIIGALADFLRPILTGNLFVGTTVLYWVTMPIVAVVEHDAYILTFLHVIQDLSTTIDPWPLYWALLWAGTLGSNLTIAGAPALYVALNLAEREEKVSMREFFSYSVPFVLISTGVTYILAILIWVLPNL